MRNDQATIAELPFDPVTQDIVCRRTPTGELDIAGNPLMKVQFNISQTVIWHSPTGFEFGYGGSGPADFALNILALFVPPTIKPPIAGEEWPEDFDYDDPYLPEQCWYGSASNFACRWHQDFKSEFIATMPQEGGTIPGHIIKAWIAARIPQLST